MKRKEFIKKTIFSSLFLLFPLSIPLTDKEIKKNMKEFISKFVEDNDGFAEEKFNGRPEEKYYFDRFHKFHKEFSDEFFPEYIAPCPAPYQHLDRASLKNGNSKNKYEFWFQLKSQVSKEEFTMFTCTIT